MLKHSMQFNSQKIALTGNQLKLVALIAMLIDHIAITLIWSIYLDASIVNGVDMMGDCIPDKAKNIYSIYLLMRIIGRVTFPIFCFMLVEGFLHTSNFTKYFIRLLILALLSEVPYDLANSGSIVSLHGQNVIWTLMLGLITLYFINKVEIYDTKKRIVLTIVLIFLGESISSLLNADGCLGGTLLISIIYMFRNRPKYMLLGGVIALGIMSIGFMWIQVFGVISFILLRYYDGTVGRGNKYIFYVFYPLHLLILGMINILI